uniref:Thioredoxin domain-containing protein n=1 Tax=Macrostomum lignano TaxID=282301 RepID=A0A1I8JLB8_9PLAT
MKTSAHLRQAHDAAASPGSGQQPASQPVLSNSAIAERVRHRPGPIHRYRHGNKSGRGQSHALQKFEQAAHPVSGNPFHRQEPKRVTNPVCPRLPASPDLLGSMKANDDEEPSAEAAEDEARSPTLSPRKSLVLEQVRAATAAAACPVLSEVQRLLPKGFPQPDASDVRQFHLAIQDHCWRLVHRLAAQYPTIVLHHHFDEPPLICAIRSGWEDMALFLVQHGASVRCSKMLFDSRPAEQPNSTPSYDWYEVSARELAYEKRMLELLEILDYLTGNYFAYLKPPVIALRMLRPQKFPDPFEDCFEIPLDFFTEFYVKPPDKKPSTYNSSSILLASIDTTGIRSSGVTPERAADPPAAESSGTSVNIIHVNPLQIERDLRDFDTAIVFYYVEYCPVCAQLVYLLHSNSWTKRWTVRRVVGCGSCIRTGVTRVPLFKRFRNGGRISERRACPSEEARFFLPILEARFFLPIDEGGALINAVYGLFITSKFLTVIIFRVTAAHSSTQSGRAASSARLMQTSIVSSSQACRLVHKMTSRRTSDEICDRDIPDKFLAHVTTAGRARDRYQRRRERINRRRYGYLSDAAAGGNQPCPVGCGCSGRSVSCSKAGLTTIPTELPDNVERLQLQNNRIERIEPGSFDELTQLERFRLADNNFICDCRLAWLSRWLRQQPQLGLHTKCSQPRLLFGSQVAELSSSDFQCSADHHKLYPSACAMAERANCPRQCYCQEDNVRCNQKDLSEVPEDIPTNVQELHLENNKITLIRRGTFRRLTQLRRL